MGLNRTIKFPILVFQTLLLIPGGDFHRQRRNVNGSISIWGMFRFFLKRQFHFEPFFACLKDFCSSLWYQVGQQRPCCIGLIWHLWKYWEQGTNTILDMMQKLNIEPKFCQRFPPMGEFVPRPWKNIARGPPQGGMSCVDELLWLPLHTGFRPWLVFIRPGDPIFPRGSPL